MTTWAAVAGSRGVFMVGSAAQKRRIVPSA
jgi:hypothetical protein